MQSTLQIIKTASAKGFRAALKTAWWILRVTVVISFGVLLLQYVGAIAKISEWLSPLFLHIGLSGEAALVFISSTLVNPYAAIAVIETVGFDPRSITILALMCLCSHNLILETTIQKKIGSSAIRMVVIRLSAAFVCAFLLNLILPKTADNFSAKMFTAQEKIFTEMLSRWAVGTLLLVVKMFTIIVSLTVLQRILADLGAIRWVSKFFRPLLRIFGLPAKTSFLWIVAQTLGLAYGAAVMMEEKETGKVSRKELDLLNHHITVSHSNLEDLLLFVAIGASLFWALFLRFLIAMVVVWERRIELHLRKS